jgi:heat shock protein HslJ
MKTLSSLLLAGVLALTSGCLNSATASAPEQGRWRLEKADDLVLPADNVQFSVEFSPDDGGVSGQVACNRWRGTLVEESAQFKLQNASSTRKRCPSAAAPALATLEQTFLKKLSDGARSSHEGAAWTLTFTDGTRWVFAPLP